MMSRILRFVCVGRYLQAFASPTTSSAPADYSWLRLFAIHLEYGILKFEQPCKLRAATQIEVFQLLPGGLSGSYWTNLWLMGTPVLQRADPEVMR